MKALYARLIGVWEGLHFEPERIIEAGDGSIVVAFTMRGRGKGSGATVAMRGGHVFTTRDGLISRCVLYPDVAEALEAVGLSE